MVTKPTIFVAGAGGIGRAVAFLLREIDAEETRGCRIILGDKRLEQAEEARRWILDGSSRDGKIDVVLMPEDLPADGRADQALDRCYREADIILDCLPGSLAARLAQAALRYGLHYVNITEYVDQTRQIRRTAADGKTAFLLQTGLAPGYVNLLGLSLVEAFCERHDATQVDRLSLRVGALTQHAEPPHFYGFTWSTVGVATEYIKPATALRHGRATEIDALTERDTVIIGGLVLEEALTSGGVANLCEYLQGRVRHLDYKTLRYPGHYAWVESTLANCPASTDRIAFLQHAMEQAIPHHDEDLVVIYVSVSGSDGNGRPRQLSAAKLIRPVDIGPRTLTAIQVTTASALAESARLLLTGSYRGVILQSDVLTETFLNGPFVSRAYRGAETLVPAYAAPRFDGKHHESAHASIAS